MKISPNYCLVTQRVIAITADSDSDEDRLPDQQTVSGEVYFTPNVPSGRAYQLRDEEGKSYTVPLGRVEASIVDGEIVHEGERGIVLFAAGEGSNPDKISYLVEYRNLRAGTTTINLSPMNFEAVPGGEVDLTTATPVTGATPAGTTKGDKGDKGDKGEPGPQGEVGPPGPHGDPGEVSLDQLNAKVPVTILAGVGSPEGKVEAPVGSVYTDTAATNGSIRWVKASGTGTTGWRDDYGDTITALETKADKSDLAAKADKSFVASSIPPDDTAIIADDSTAWAQATATGDRLPLGYTDKGRLDEFARTVWNEDVNNVFNSADDGSTAYVATSADGHVIARVGLDGSVDIPGLIQAAPTPPPPHPPLPSRGAEFYRTIDGSLAPMHADTTRIDGWGSSSMEYMGDDIAAALGDLPLTYTNYAKGGEMIEHNAARMGVEPAIVNPVTIPTTGSVDVTLENVPRNVQMKPFDGVLAGVFGTLSCTSTTFVFTRETPGDLVEVATPSPFIPDLPPTLLQHTQVMQLGKNNSLYSSSLEIVPRLSTKIMKSLTPFSVRVLFLGHHFNRNWEDGNPRYDRVRAFDDHLRKLVGEECFIDIHAITTGQEIWDRTGITPTAQDLIDQENGILPGSLAMDYAHFNQATDLAIAEIIRERIDSLNWY